MLALRDITAEREIADMKNEFVSTVSHELRTPLTSIKGYVDLILDGSAGEINEIQQEFLGIVKENSDRLVELINEMLDISRIESGRVHLQGRAARASPSRSRARSTRSERCSRRPGARSTCTCPSTCRSWSPTATASGQVLINLISNALKYSPGGGEVVDHGASTHGDFVIVSVTDQGLGISREDQKRLFTKFYRVDSAMTREIGGTGLGLSICKTIIELLGGEIGVQEQAGRGLDVLVQLAGRARGDGAHAVARGPGRGRRHGARHRPRPRGRRPHRDLPAARATTWSRRTPPTRRSRWRSQVKPRAITLDVILDEGDGFDLLHRLKEQPGDRATSRSSCSRSCATRGSSCRMGAANYLEKPIDQGRLLKMIDEIVGSISSPVALVVDDDRDVVRVLSETLRKKGFAVVGAYDGAEAIAALEQRIPDIIVTDLKMPKMDGYELIQRVKTTPEWADVPIVVMTAHRIDRGRIDILELATHRLQQAVLARGDRRGGRGAPRSARRQEVAT